MEHHSSIERIVGDVSEVEKEKTFCLMDDRFDNQRYEYLAKLERDKTPEELQAITVANEVTNQLRKQYGLENLDIPPENIHVVEEKKWPAEEHGGAFTGLYLAQFQAAVVREQPTRMEFLRHTIHEMIHFKSYNALQFTKEQNPKLTEYRLGLATVTRDRSSAYFNNLNEAVTEGLTKKLLQELSGHPLLRSEVARTEELKERYGYATAKSGEALFTQDTFCAYLAHGSAGKEILGRVLGTERQHNIVEVAEYAYARERGILNELAGKIVKRNPDRFRDAGEVLKMFAEGMMTGNLLPLARAVDGTFGKGTLRRIGELDGDVEAAEVFVRGL